MEYVYCKETKLTEEIAMDLIVYCDKIIFPNLKVECERTLAKSLGMENAFAIYEVAEEAQAGNLKEAAVRFIRNNVKEISKNIGLENIPNPLLLEIIENKLC